MKRREVLTWAGIGVGIAIANRLPLLVKGRGDLDYLGEFAKKLTRPVIGAAAQAATPDQDQSAEQTVAIAMLRTIPSAEGTWYPGKQTCKDGVWTSGSLCDSYRIIFTYQEFESFKDHPRLLCGDCPLCSDAAGSFQWLSTHYDNLVKANRNRFNWDANEYFSPTNQDVATLFRIGAEGAYWLMLDGVSVDEQGKLSVDKGTFEKWCWQIAGTWAGIPRYWTDTKGYHGQGCKPMPWLWKVFNQQLGTA